LWLVFASQKVIHSLLVLVLNV